MKTVAVISQKGGAGKTTIAIHLAVASSLDNKNTAIIDLDPQASSAKWSDRRLQLSDVPVVLSAHASRLKPEMNRVAANGGDVLFIDTAPHSDSAALEAAKVADLILVPCKPSILDLEAISSTIDLVSTTGKPIFVVLNAVGASVKERDDAREAIRELGVEVCDTHLSQRVAFSRALITGQTAQEFEPNGKARGEVDELHAFVCAHIQEIETA